MNIHGKKIREPELSETKHSLKQKRRIEPNKQKQKYGSGNSSKICKFIWSYFKRHHLAILALVIALIGGLPGLAEWLQKPQVIGRLVDISYDPKDERAVLSEDRTKFEFKKGVSYYAQVHLISLKKNYNVADVHVFIALKSNDLIEGELHRTTVPLPNSDSVPIQYLSLLEKDRLRLCYVNFFLEGEQKVSIDDMTFEKIELRLYDHKGKYKKVELFLSDVPE